MEPLLLRVNEVARLLGVSRSTAYAIVATGELPSVRLGRAVRVRRTDLEAWLSQKAVAAEDDSVSGSP